MMFGHEGENVNANFAFRGNGAFNSLENYQLRSLGHLPRAPCKTCFQKQVPVVKGPIKMRISFNEQKATQAAARLLELRGGRISYLKLIKLLYLADREALLQWGRPITTDSY